MRVAGRPPPDLRSSRSGPRRAAAAAPPAGDPAPRRSPDRTSPASGGRAARASARRGSGHPRRAPPAGRTVPRRRRSARSVRGGTAVIRPVFGPVFGMRHASYIGPHPRRGNHRPARCHVRWQIRWQVRWQVRQRVVVRLRHRPRGRRPRPSRPGRCRPRRGPARPGRPRSRAAERPRQGSVPAGRRRQALPGEDRAGPAADPGPVRRAEGGPVGPEAEFGRGLIGGRAARLGRARRRGGDVGHGDAASCRAVDAPADDVARRSPPISAGRGPRVPPARPRPRPGAAGSRRG